MLDANGAVYALGDASNGQIPGYSSSSSSSSSSYHSTPVSIPIPRASQIHCYHHHSCAVCNDGIYFWPSFRKGKDKREGKRIESPTKVNTMCYLSLEIISLACADGFTVMLSKSGQLFGFYYYTSADCTMTATARSVFSPTVMPGCISEILPGVVGRASDNDDSQ